MSDLPSRVPLVYQIVTGKVVPTILQENLATHRSANLGDDPQVSVQRSPRETTQFSSLMLYFRNGKPFYTIFATKSQTAIQATISWYSWVNQNTFCWRISQMFLWPPWPHVLLFPLPIFLSLSAVLEVQLPRRETGGNRRIAWR